MLEPEPGLYHCIFNIPVLLAFPADCSTACSLSLLNSIQFPESLRPTVDAGQRGSSSSELGEDPVIRQYYINQYTDSLCIKIKSFSFQNASSG